MKVDGNMVTLDRKECKELINNECQRGMGMSAAEFLWKHRHSEFPDEYTPNVVRILLKLVYK